MNKRFIAHVRQDTDGIWAAPHPLSDHLEDTAKMAEQFAAKFDSCAWGKAAGFAHDAGKGRKEWQNYLRLKSGYFDEEAHLEGKPGKMPHAIYGAKLVEELYGKTIGRVLSYCIAGHHAGLPDWSSAEGAGQSSLEFQLSREKDIHSIEQFIRKRTELLKPLALPWGFFPGLGISLWIRMLYSCLVDADFLDTEAYMERGNAEARGNYCSIDELLKRLNDFNEQLDKESEDTPLNLIRRNIRTKCIEMAKEAQGFFSLSVPTGGGKTLSSLAFGLEHAKEYNLDRIIYVIPYTSIIEQNANVFRKVFGHDQIVEHHSSLDESKITVKSRLAAENWDAPVIVTTSVQFFESLFAVKSSRCRKLHNIVNSVVILDEAQLVPVEHLAPILETMQLLVDHYRVSFVICTATQPAFGEHTIGDSRFKGLKNIREIMGTENDVNRLYSSLKRVHIHLPKDLHKPLSWEEVAEELKKYPQVLCIVSDRKSCRELHKIMPDGTFHLSALMCGQHRSEVIEDIERKLKNKETVRVISTQLIEAGVDLDFPVVYRAFAGLDSIAQAAGRCNREGKISDLGKVIVFVGPRKAPLGILRKAADTARNILSADDKKDPLNYSIYKRYFSELYWKANSLDTKSIIPLLNPSPGDLGIYFKKVAKEFQMIDDSRQKTIFVRYGEGDTLIDELKSQGPDRILMRKLQRYTVNVHIQNFKQMHNRASVEEVYPGIFTLTSSIEYSKDIGLMVEEVILNPEDLIC